VETQLDNEVLSPVGMEEQFSLEQFLYNEADLLDERRFTEWLALMHDDIDYRIPVRHDRKQASRDENWAIDKELSSGDDELHLSVNNKLSLMARTMRLMGNRSFSEVPPSRTTRLITNVQAFTGEDENTYLVRSKFQVHRTRMERGGDWFSGSRRDVVVRDGDGFQIKSRCVILNCNVLESANLSIFF